MLSAWEVSHCDMAFPFLSCVRIAFPSAASLTIITYVCLPRPPCASCFQVVAFAAGVLAPCEELDLGLRPFLVWDVVC
jgi:hypothetical protein